MICGCDCYDVHHWSFFSFHHFETASKSGSPTKFAWTLTLTHFSQQWKVSTVQMKRFHQSDGFKTVWLKRYGPQGLPCLGLCTGPEASAGKHVHCDGKISSQAAEPVDAQKFPHDVYLRNQFMICDPWCVLKIMCSSICPPEFKKKHDGRITMGCKIQRLKWHVRDTNTR